MPPLLPVLPGTPERRSHDYQRHGTPSGFAALNLPMGEIVGGLPRRRHTQEFNENLLQAHDGLRTIAPPAARESPPSRDWRSTRWPQVEAGVPYALGDRRVPGHPRPFASAM